MQKRRGTGRKAVSSVITSILLVLIVLLVVAIVYNVVVPIARQGAGGIENQTESFIQSLFSPENIETSKVSGRNLNPKSFTGQIIYNSESCYIQLEINEKRGEELFGNNWCNNTDINRDGKLDANDYDIIDKWYLFHKNEINACSADNNWCNGSDINRDRRIDANDYDIIDKWNLFHKGESCSGLGENIEFSLQESESLYGLYAHSVNKYNPEIPGDYILRTYDSNGNILNNYALSSGRFIFYDNFEEGNPGGVIELDEGTISAVIPYDYRIANIKVDFNGFETDLNIGAGDFKCERTCLLENEVGVVGEDKCCLSFNEGIVMLETDKDGGKFVCSKCGDGICSESEKNYCYEDCAEDFECEFGTVRGEFGCMFKNFDGNGCGVINTSGDYLLNKDIYDNSIMDSCIRITAENVVLDCQGHSIKSDTPFSGVYSNQKNTIIKNCKISLGENYGKAGILLENADNSKILNNILNGQQVYGEWNSKGQYNGLYVKNSKNVRIENNIASNNVMVGIWLEGCSKCVVMNNTANSNAYSGIYFSGSSNNSLWKNTANNNNFDGININSKSNFNLITENIACNNAKNYVQYSDFRCSDSSGSSGGMNTFGNVTKCADGFPIGGNKCMN